MVFLGVMGIALNRAFESSVLESAEGTLRNQILLLMSSIEVEGELAAPSEVAEPRLLRPDSNLFAQIMSSDNPDSAVSWKSPSLLDRKLPVFSGSPGEFKFRPSEPWLDSSINVMSLSVEWETEHSTVPFLIVVSESDELYTLRLQSYKQQVLLWLSIFGSALVVLLLGMLNWTLNPLDRVRVQVNDIEEGKRSRFDEDYPLEVTQLTKNLNQLLSYEERRINRQREVLGNLAHSLKTPLAVLKGIAFKEEVEQDAQEQLNLIQDIIDYQLQSASTIGRRRFVKAFEIDLATQQILRSLEKIYAEKNLKVSCTIYEGAQFFGDEGDWMEVVGNICENAFKWSRSKVSVSIKNLHAGDGSRRLPIEIVVQDDGPGIGESYREKILQRGVRLDSQTPGHGLGMHIVKGIVEAYDGQLKIEESEFESGIKFVVVLT